jgi:hypothetical protein
MIIIDIFENIFSGQTTISEADALFRGPQPDLNLSISDMYLDKNTL